MTTKDLTTALAKARYVRSDPDNRLSAESTYELSILVRILRDALVEAEAREATAPRFGAPVALVPATAR